MTEKVLFVSWCPLDLVRPRAVQVGRVGKAVRQHGWQADLVCAAFESQIEQDLFDSELFGLYRSSFGKITATPDLGYFGLAQSADRPKDFASLLLAAVGLRREAKPWVESATRAAVRQVRYLRKPVVVSFAQPWSSHEVGLGVKRSAPGVRWIAHFSDPWVDNPYLASTGADLEPAKQEEQTVIHEADAVIFVTQEAADLVMKKYPDEWRHKVRVIPHMLDLDMMSLLGPASGDRGPQLRLTHTGSLYGGKRAPMGLFEALRDLRHSGQLENNIEVHLVGETPENVIKTIDRYGLRGIVTWTTPLYYIPSLREMRRADALLVIDADLEKSPFLPSKTVDYLMFDRPIVGLSPGSSATTRFLAEIGYASVGPNDVAGIKKLILTLVRSWDEGTLRPTEAHARVRRDYDTHAIGARYMELFESA